MMKNMSELTPKQQRFCEEYVVDCNGTQAAIRAGYSEKTAVEQASRLLINVKVGERINELQKSKQITTGYNAERIIAMHEEIYHAAIADKQYAPAVAVVKALTDLHGIEPAKEMKLTSNLPVMINFVARDV
jgi:phage terminase small subunit